MVPRVWGAVELAVIGTSRMAGDRRGARTDDLVLGALPAPPAPCPCSLPR
ncbi:MAG: hypothetical protein M0Z95_10680 [Actinomycetota bacterium]|nr:hypothetical protein [Actinomycetota bacterium]